MQSVRAHLEEFSGAIRSTVVATEEGDKEAAHVLRQAQAAQVLGLLSATCYKVGAEVYELMKDEFGEVEEPGVISFNSGRGVKRFEFRSSPNKNVYGEAIVEGTQVKILSRRTSLSVSSYRSTEWSNIPSIM